MGETASHRTGRPIPVPGGTVAACFALAAFAIAVLSGLLADNHAATILARALFAMLACYPLGLLAAIVTNCVLNDAAGRTGDHIEPPIDTDGEPARNAKSENR